MPVKMNGKIYYRTKEVCGIIGVAKSTLLRWFREGVTNDVRTRDRRGWRLFDEEEVNKLIIEANRVKLDMVDYNN